MKRRRPPGDQAILLWRLSSALRTDALQDELAAVLGALLSPSFKKVSSLISLPSSSLALSRCSVCLFILGHLFFLLPSVSLLFSVSLYTLYF